MLAASIGHSFPILRRTQPCAGGSIDVWRIIPSHETSWGRPGRDGAGPRRLFPCFRDRDELPLSADLGDTIEDALRASRYLIVICTPASARSRWVNEEVRYFKSLGRADRILAIIAGGEPNASDQ